MLAIYAQKLTLLFHFVKKQKNKQTNKKTAQYMEFPDQNFLFYK